jgi:hypothetical protein
LENESIATRGVSPKRRTRPAVRRAISARSSALGSMLTVVSATNRMRSRSIRM